MKYVIIGAGAAGLSAAIAVKKTDPGAEVVIIGKENLLPYNRSRLTSYFYNALGEEELFYIPADFFEKPGVRLRKGQWVKIISPPEKSVKLHHNEVIHYDKLLIASGASPRLGPVLRPFEKLIQRYYTLQDLRLLKKTIGPVQDCIVYGSGLSGLDLIYGLLQLGKKITYIVDGKQPDWALINENLYQEFCAFFKEKDVRVLTEERITSIEKKNDVFHVRTLNGVELTADIVFAWDEYRPNLSFIENSAIEKKLGILVNDHLETNIEDIYAAGDCVEIFHEQLKTYLINFGWANALEQGEIAGLNMTGRKTEYKLHESLDFHVIDKSIRARWWK